MKRIIYIALSLLLLSCKSEIGVKEPAQESFEISAVTIPAEIKGRPGDIVECWAKGLKEGDMILLEDVDSSLETPVLSVTSSRFSFALPEKVKTGNYALFAKRGNLRKALGQTYVSIVAEGEIPDSKGMTLKGLVHCGGKGLQGVVVSDGFEVTVTDADGVYYLPSKKEMGYVFISVPSGYECPRTGVMPSFYQFTTKPATVSERLDFTLNEAPSQDKHRMLVFGDIHLANRTNKDRNQFSLFCNDVNALLATTTVPSYGLTLGDMTFDIYWYSNGYFLENYLVDAAQIKNLSIFHTIGNHDHESGKKGAYPAGEFMTTAKYRVAMGPTYYSFNIGKVHYVVLDNIFSKNDGQGNVAYDTSIDSDQFAWLKKDLSYVTKDKTLVLTSHAPMHSKTGTVTMTGYTTLGAYVKEFANVHLFTGHTHLVYNVIDRGIFEHNAGAVCATWWWSVHHSGIHVAQDGAPGGYTVLDFDSGTPSWQFKGTGHPLDYQFRTYDGNCIEITGDRYIPSKSAELKTKFNNYASMWTKPSSDNNVYINVWNWDPEWKVEVSEEGKSLAVTKVSLRDPLHLIAYTAPSIDQPSFATSDNYHFFKTTASNANSTLEIKVTDRFGNVYRETMVRPKPFSIATYK